jgi:multimeric flavodoxin WrbA
MQSEPKPCRKASTDPMRIVCLVGSPHGKKGNTARLLQEVIRGAGSRGATAEVLVVAGQRLHPCRACNRCHIEGRCPQKDDFEAIKAKIVAADGLILASPNYINQVSAQLKAFIDRCCGVIHCLGFEGRYGASVVTSGGGPEKMIADYMNGFLISTGIHPVGSVYATMAEMPGDGFSEAVRRRAFGLGQRLVGAWTTQKRHQWVDRRMEAFRARMRALIAYRKNEWPFEYAFWKQRGEIR